MELYNLKERIIMFSFLTTVPQPLIEIGNYIRVSRNQKLN